MEAATEEEATGADIQAELSAMVTAPTSSAAAAVIQAREALEVVKEATEALEVITDWTLMSGTITKITPAAATWAMATTLMCSKIAILNPKAFHRAIEATTNSHCVISLCPSLLHHREELTCVGNVSMQRIAKVQTRFKCEIYLFRL